MQKSVDKRSGIGAAWHERFGLMMMSADEEQLNQRLRMHVEQLAGKIGERNVFCPRALQAAASYIEHEWAQQGYAVTQLGYEFREFGA